MRHCLPLIARCRETNWVTGESRSTGRAERTSVREHVRPSQTHAGEVGVHAPQADVTELRLVLLDELAADVNRIYSGVDPQSPVMRAMAETVRECGVPAQ